MRSGSGRSFEIHVPDSQGFIVYLENENPLVYDIKEEIRRVSKSLNLFNTHFLDSFDLLNSKGFILFDEYAIDQVGPDCAQLKLQLRAKKPRTHTKGKKIEEDEEPASKPSKSSTGSSSKRPLFTENGENHAESSGSNKKHRDAESSKLAAKQPARSHGPKDATSMPKEMNGDKNPAATAAMADPEYKAKAKEVKAKQKEAAAEEAEREVKEKEKAKQKEKEKEEKKKEKEKEKEKKEKEKEKGKGKEQEKEKGKGKEKEEKEEKGRKDKGKTTNSKDKKLKGMDPSDTDSESSSDSDSDSGEDEIPSGNAKIVASTARSMPPAELIKATGRPESSGAEEKKRKRDNKETAKKSKENRDKQDVAKPVAKLPAPKVQLGDDESDSSDETDKVSESDAEDETPSTQVAAQAKTAAAFVASVLPVAPRFSSQPSSAARLTFPKPTTALIVDDEESSSDSD